MKREQLVRLVGITETALTAAQAAMARVQQREADLRQQLLDLRGRQSQEISESAATRAGADVRWNRWVDKRREDINSELARVLAEKERVRAKLRVAFGKDQAMQKLIENVQSDLNRRRNKKH